VYDNYLKKQSKQSAMKTQVNHLPVRHRTLNVVLTTALSLMTVFAIVFVVKTYQRSNYLSHFSIPVRTVNETAAPMAINNLPEVVIVGHATQPTTVSNNELEYLPVMSVPEVVITGKNKPAAKVNQASLITAMPAVYEYLSPSTSIDEEVPVKERIIKAMPATFEYLTPESTEFAEDVIPLESWMYSPVEWSKSVQLAGNAAIDTAKTLAN